MKKGRKYKIGFGFVETLSFVDTLHFVDTLRLVGSTVAKQTSVVELQLSSAPSECGVGK
jgi:hypothetical protein